MTALLSPSSDGVASPGMPPWGIVADLTPPEVIRARAIKVLRRFLIVGLVVLLALCVAGAVFARRSEAAAQRQLDAANDRSTTLSAQQAKYTTVPQIQAATSNIRSQLGTLFASDVTVAALLAHFQAVVPQHVRLTSVTITPNGPGGAAASTSDPAVTQVGTVTLVGTAEEMNDVATYATKLEQIRGVTDVIPSNNTKQTHSVSWTATAILTDAVLSHRYGSGSAAQTTPATTDTSTSGGN